MERQGGGSLMAGVAGAILVPGLVFGCVLNGIIIISALTPHKGHSGTPLNILFGDLILVVLTLIVGAILALPVAFGIGLPAHAIFKRLGLRGWLPYSLLGLPAGAAVSCLLAALSPQAGQAHGGQALHGLWLMCPLGVVGAMTFWLIARPDRAARVKRLEPGNGLD